MHLQNGNYYKDSDGVAVRADLKADDFFHCVDAAGEVVHKVPLTSPYDQDVDDGKGGTITKVMQRRTHVEGWQPIGAAVFAAEVPDTPLDDEPPPDDAPHQKKHRKRKATRQAGGEGVSNE